MPRFFHGWRRKTGLVTLVVALAVTAMQFRSRDAFDGLYLDGKQTQYSFVSADSQFRFMRRTSRLRQPIFIHWIIGAKLDDTCRDPFARGNVEWRRDWLHANCGVFSVQETQFPMRVQLLAVPHWFLILPLTLLSAYLLLSRPRQSSPTKTEGA